MSIETLGGREYYTKAVKSVIDENFTDVPAGTKAILFITGDTYVWRYNNPSGSVTDIELVPDTNQMVNIIPDKIAVHDATNRDIYFLF